MMLVHLCRTCGHRENWHTPEADGRPSSCSNALCKCGRLDPDPQPSLAPTYANDTPRAADGMISRIIPPGQAMNPDCPPFSHRVVACDCDQCETRYRQLTGHAS